MKIALRYHFANLKNHKDWFIVLNSMQRNFNNSSSVATIKTANEICYNFISCISTDLISIFASLKFSIKQIVQDSIAFSQVLFKIHYDRKHKNCQLQVNDWILLKLHKRYDISFIAILNKKLFQQYVDFFRILKKIENLTYRLQIFEHWKIHSIISVAQLEFFLFSFNDQQSSSSVSMKDESIDDKIRSYEIEKILIKRINRQRNTKYLVKWLDYDSENDFWRSLSEMKNAMKLV